MPIAFDMKNIAEGIEVSYSERIAFLSDLFKETDETLKTFNREHQKMSTNLEDFLSSDRVNREDIVASLRGKNKRELKAMAEQLANLLKNNTSATKRETVALMGQIREFIELVANENSELKKETVGLLSDFHASHKEMAQTLRNSLSSEIRRQSGKVKEMLIFFDGEHKTRSNQVKSELYSFNKKLKSSVGETRSANRSDQRQARDHWRSLSRILAAKRAGKAVTSVKRIEGVAKVEVAGAVEAFTVGNLKEQILRLVSETASGMKLAKMGAILAVPYIRLARPASDLIKQGMIKKVGSRYSKV